MYSLKLIYVIQGGGGHLANWKGYWSLPIISENRSHIWNTDVVCFQSGEINSLPISQVTCIPLFEKTYSTEATNATLDEWDEGQPASDVLTPQCWHEGHIQVVMTTQLHGAHHQEPPAVWHPHWATRTHHHTTQLYGKIAYSECQLINNCGTRPWGYCTRASLSLTCQSILANV